MKKAKQWQILNYALAYGRQQKANSDLKALASKIGDDPCVLSPPIGVAGGGAGGALAPPWKN